MSALLIGELDGGLGQVVVGYVKMFVTLFHLMSVSELWTNGWKWFWQCLRVANLYIQPTNKQNEAFDDDYMMMMMMQNLVIYFGDDNDARF